jgi:hypothetical protein
MTKDLDAGTSPKQVKEGAALWCVLFTIGGLAHLSYVLGIMAAVGVAFLGLGVYFAAVHTIYSKIEHFKAAVLLWNEVEQLQQKEIDHDQRP